MKDVILLAGGGGHTAYALSLAQELTGKCNLKIFVPEGDNLSYNRLLPYGDTKFLLKSRGPKTGKISFIFNLGKSFLICLKIIKGKSIIVSTGSNFAIPPCLIAWMKKGQIINVVESVRFDKASITTNILSKFSKLTALQWKEQKKLFPTGEVFGPMLAKSPLKPYDGGYILVTGGTFGHDLLFKTLDSLEIENIVLQTGPLSKKSLAEKHPKWKIIDYSDKFEELLAGAEVVVTHFGATLIESTLIHGKPTVVAYNPEVTKGARYEDLLVIMKKTNAVLFDKFEPDILTKAIETAKNQKPPFIESGAGALAKRILSFAKSEE
jgi:UDP-N-acetylglucosamine:LPS N-acetylglucosamine transferase